MKVFDLGETGLIELISKMVSEAQDRKAKSWQQLILGIGDDAAAWHGDSSIQLATVDALRENVHFTRELISWEDLGWKALAVNLSDIAAMGALPRYALVSLALPGETEVDSIIALYKGLIKLAKQSGVAIIGGDVDRASLVDITVAVIGNTVHKELLTRSAARPGDKVAVTGYLGAAAAGLEMLVKHLEFDPETAASLKKAFLTPEHRVSEGQILVEQGVRAAIDISDGLVRDLCHICEASKVGARVEIDRVPVHPALRANFGDRVQEFALSGGEDYELLFTASTEVIKRVKAAASCPVTVIGEITSDTPGKVTVVDSMGNPISLPKAGWEHFKIR